MRSLVSSLHSVTGCAGGLGWVALIGLVASKLGHNHGPIATVIAAVGQRSMSSYRFPSVVFTGVFGHTDDHRRIPAVLTPCGRNCVPR